ncbi:virulence metalloprotease-like [Saccostrea echinata]|uniref:virulence metalloprotease-like n=1 Tax=Saccostrea echinata TaxID=191078 RepID=UPI002A82D239|nr:virulence metalloprotease-like [Saccostrea echinata]
MSRRCAVFFLVSLFSVGQALGEMDPETSLQKALFNGYNRYRKPVRNRTVSVSFGVTIKLYSIEHVNEKTQTFSSIIWLAYVWKDEYLRWNISEYDIKSLRIPAVKVWVPSVCNLNELEIGKKCMTFESVKDNEVFISHEGVVRLYDTVRSSIQCEINVLKYPFDEQRCTYAFQSLLSDTHQTEIIDNYSFIHTSSLTNNGEWSLLSVEKEIKKTRYVSSNSTYSNINFVVKIRRRPILAILTSVIPIVALSAMNIFCFVLPVEAGEKIGMSMALFLTFAVFASILSDTMPSSSENISWFSVYVTTQVILSAIVVILETIVLRIYHRDPMSNENKDNTQQFYCTTVNNGVEIYTVQILGHRKLDVRIKINEVLYERRRNIRNSEQPRAVSRVRELLMDNNNGLKVVDNGKSIESTKILRLQETYKDIPIFNAYITEEVDSDTDQWTGQVSGSWYDELEEDIIDVVPRLSEDEALSAAVLNEGLNNTSALHKSEILLMIMPTDGGAILCYDVTLTIITPETMKRPGYIIDANSGQILYRIQRLQNFGINAVGGNNKTQKIKYGEDFPPLKVKIGKARKKCRLKSNYVRVFDLQTAKTLPSKSKPYTFPCSKGIKDNVNGGFSPMSDAFYISEQVFKMFEDWAHTPVVTKPPVDVWVHYGKLQFEASYNGEGIIFGDGGKYYYPLVTYDIVGHEFAHIFTEGHSHLVYANQSGGINEAYSDLAGEALELYITGMFDLHTGAKSDKNDNEGIRDLCDQNKDGSSIVHVKNYQDGMEVHESSGIFNKVSCTLIKEPTFGLKIVFQIFTHANRFYWAPYSNFSDAACGVLKAAYDLGHDTEIIRKAFKVVGINVCEIETYMRKIYGKTHIKSLTAKGTENIVFGFDGRTSSGQLVRIFTEGGSGDVDLYVNNDLNLDKTLTTYISTYKGNVEVIQIPFKQCLMKICYIHLVPKAEGFREVSFQLNII